MTLGQAFILKTCMPHCLHTLPLYVDINGGRGRYIYFKAKYLSKNSFFLDFISMLFKVFVYGICYIYKFKYSTNDSKMNNEIIFYFLLKAKKKCLQFQDKLSWSTIHDVYLMFYVCYEIKVFKKKTFVLFKSPTTSTHGEISMPCCHMNFKRHIV